MIVTPPLIENPLSLLTTSIDVTDKRLLDVGCGAGENLLALSDLGAVVTGVEPNPRGDVAGVEIIKSGAETLPFEDASFDVVCFFYSLHHVPITLMKTAINEARRVLVDGGILYVIDPHPSGSLYELIRFVDDEKDVQTQAGLTLKAAIVAKDFKLEWENRIMECYDYAGFDDYRADVVGVDAARTAAFDEQKAEQAILYEKLGVAHEGKKRFYQNCFAAMMTKRKG